MAVGGVEDMGGGRKGEGEGERWWEEFNMVVLGVVVVEVSI